jgi:outer membrane protein OmpA-like peptidoglycan-associated protein
MTSKQSCQGTNRNGEPCGNVVSGGEAYCRWHEGQAQTRTGSNPAAESGPRPRTLRAHFTAIVGNNLTLVMPVLYLLVCFTGITYEYALLKKFGIDFFEFADVSDFLVPGLRQPLALVVCVGLLVALYALIRLVSAIQRSSTRYHEKISQPERATFESAAFRAVRAREVLEAFLAKADATRQALRQPADDTRAQHGSVATTRQESRTFETGPGRVWRGIRAGGWSFVIVAARIAAAPPLWVLNALGLLEYVAHGGWRGVTGFAKVATRKDLEFGRGRGGAILGISFVVLLLASGAFMVAAAHGDYARITGSAAASYDPGGQAEADTDGRGSSSTWFARLFNDRLHPMRVSMRESRTRVVDAASSMLGPVSRNFPSLTVLVEKPEECLAGVRLVSSTRSHVLLYQTERPGAARAVASSSLAAIHIFQPDVTSKDAFDGPCLEYRDRKRQQEAARRQSEAHEQRRWETFVEVYRTRADSVQAQLQGLSATIEALSGAVAARPRADIGAHDAAELRAKLARIESRLTRLSSAHAVDVGTRRYSCPRRVESQSVFFDPGSTEIDDPLELDNLVALMAGTDLVILVEGFADEAGDATYNLRVSERRADYIKNVLVSIGGIDPSRIKAVGWGERFHRPTARGERSGDRRVDVTACAGDVPWQPRANLARSSTIPDVPGRISSLSLETVGLARQGIDPRVGPR